MQLDARAEQPGRTPGGPDTVVPLVVGPVSFGTLRVERPADRRPLSPHDQQLLEALSKQAAAAIDRARLDARARLAQLDAETNQLRAAMFSSVTHDFRTPLASIKAGVTSLLDDTVQHDPGQERELLTTILEETDRLNRLVGNILDLARIRAGALIPARHEAGLDEIAEAVVARLAPRLDPIQVQLDIDDDVPSVAVDEMQLDQVITNLLENAARHSPARGVIRVSVSSDDDRVVGSGVGSRPGHRRGRARAHLRGLLPGCLDARFPGHGPRPRDRERDRGRARRPHLRRGRPGGRRLLRLRDPVEHTQPRRSGRDGRVGRGRRAADPPRVAHEPRGARLRGRHRRNRRGRRGGRRRAGARPGAARPRSPGYRRHRGDPAGAGVHRRPGDRALGP